MTAAHDRLGLVVVAANEHGGFAALELRIDHHGVADRAERLDEVRVGEGVLQALHQGLIEVGEKLQHAVGRWRFGDGVGGIDHRLAGQVGRARRLERFKRGSALDREHDKFAKLRGVGGAAGKCTVILREEIGKLSGIARTEHHLVSMLEEAAGQSFGHVARS